MKTRKLGYSDLELTEVGFGAWAIGGGDYAFGWGPQDDKESIAAIRRALELGVNWIDTAAIYGLGHSETVVAKAIEGRRDEVIIATKCTRRWDKKRNTYGDMSAKGIREECEQSLKRLNIDVIDLYQIHWPDPDEMIEEAWGAIANLVTEGKIRYGGVSNYTAEQMARSQATQPIASLQPPYSMMRRGVEGDVFSFCEENDVGVVAYSPMQSGLLTGKFDKDKLGEGDWREHSTEFMPPNLDVNLWMVEQLREIADKYDKTVAQLVVAWTLRLGVVTSSIVGARRPSQIEETVGGADWKIEDEDLSLIEELLKLRQMKIQSVGGVVRT